MRRAIAGFCIVVLLGVGPRVARAEGDLINYGLLDIYGGSAACQYYSDYAWRLFDGLSSGLTYSSTSVWVLREWDTPRTLAGVRNTLAAAVGMTGYSLRVDAWVGTSWSTVLDLASIGWSSQSVMAFSAVETTKIRLTYNADKQPWRLEDVALLGELTATLAATPSAGSVHLRAEDLTPPLDISCDGEYIGSTGTLEYYDTAYVPGAQVTYTATDANGKRASVNVLTCPAAPMPTVTDTTTTTVQLSWPTVPTATAYRLYRSGQFIGSTSGQSYTDGNLAPSTVHTYKVSAVNPSGEGRSAEVVAATIEQPPPPEAPTNLRLVSRSGAALSVAWDPVPGVGGYKVYLDGGLYTLTTSTSATITALADGTSYTFAVQAYTGIYDGAISNALVATTIGKPNAVANLTVIPGPITLTLSWLAPATGDPPTSYRIYLAGELVGSSTSSSYTITGLTVDTTYTVGVAGVNEAGEGALATEVTATSSLEPPAQITGLLVTTTVRTATLDWDQSPEADAYRVYLDGIEVAQVSYPAYALTGLCPLTDYLLDVRAVNAAGIGEPASALVRTLSGKPTILKLTPSGSGYILTYHGPIGPDAPDEYMIYADDIWRTSAYVPTQWPDTDMEWTTGSTHEIRVDAIYGPVTASDIGTITAYVAVDPVGYPPPTELFEGILQDWSQVILLVTALSIVWMAWDWWRGLMSRDPYRYDG